MTAIDTNVVVRLLTKDDPDQFRAARSLLDTTVCFTPDSVILETGWVLESVYELDRDEIVRGLRAFLGLENVRVDDFERLRQALDWYAEGLDFADALHLAACQSQERFKTFDEPFAREAKGKGTCPVLSV